MNYNSSWSEESAPNSDLARLIFPRRENRKKPNSSQTLADTTTAGAEFSVAG